MEKTTIMLAIPVATAVYGGRWAGVQVPGYRVERAECVPFVLHGALTGNVGSRTLKLDERVWCASEPVSGANLLTQSWIGENGPVTVENLIAATASRVSNYSASFGTRVIEFVAEHHPLEHLASYDEAQRGFVYL